MKYIKQVSGFSGADEVKALSKLVQIKPGTIVEFLNPTEKKVVNSMLPTSTGLFYKLNKKSFDIANENGELFNIPIPMFVRSVRYWSDQEDVEDQQDVEISRRVRYD